MLIADSEIEVGTAGEETALTGLPVAAELLSLLGWAVAAANCSRGIGGGGGEDRAIDAGSATEGTGGGRKPFAGREIADADEISSVAGKQVTV